jgi:hypothetical protein
MPSPGVQVVEETAAPLSRFYTLHFKGVKCSENNVTDLIKALPGNSSVNIVQHATMQEPVSSMP